MQQDTMTLPNVDMNLLEQPTLEKVRKRPLNPIPIFNSI